MRAWVIILLLVSIVVGAAALPLHGTKGVAGWTWLVFVGCVGLFLGTFSLLLARWMTQAHRNLFDQEIERKSRDSGSEKSPDKTEASSKNRSR